MIGHALDWRVRTGEVGCNEVHVGELEDVEQGDEVVVHERSQRRLGAVHVHLAEGGGDGYTRWIGFRRPAYLASDQV